jgi:hypothetical protein
VTAEVAAPESTPAPVNDKDGKIAETPGSDTEKPEDPATEESMKSADVAPIEASRHAEETAVPETPEAEILPAEEQEEQG